MLTITNLRVMYDGVVEGVRDASLQVGEGRIVALLGANGAGKSTVLKAISGILYTEDGAITDGTIRFNGDSIDRADPQRIVRAGLVQVPEGRRLFDTLSVDENLLAGGSGLTRAALRRAVDQVFEVFPELLDHRRRVAGLLSGGQQQMVAIGRALMAQPRLLMLDEPSLGLAPQVADKILDTVRRLRDAIGLTVLLVEQNARAALELADYGYIMDRGRVVLDGESAALLRNDDVREFYLGVSAQGQQRSMREVKHYRRRKRWLA
ncbi:MAG: ABC transporter ATP-binding protein [Burkholderiaceae bacterium]